VALAGELHKAGFREVTWRNLTFGIVAVHVAVK
jgi:ubiquinone/menaquinone biosynthesis C-methylase UbiE